MFFSRDVVDALFSPMPQLQRETVSVNDKQVHMFEEFGNILCVS